MELKKGINFLFFIFCFILLFWEEKKKEIEINKISNIIYNN